MPKPYPREFRDDVVWVARNREAGVSLSQVAADFGIHEMTLQKWLRADDESAQSAPSADQTAELRELKRRNRLLEQENEVLRRAAAYLSQDQIPGKALPARKRAGRRRDPRGGHVPGAEDRSPALPPVASSAGDQHRISQAHVANAVFDAHRDAPEFGYRLLADQAVTAGFTASERTIWRICADNGWSVSVSRKNRGQLACKPALPAREDLVRRQFTAEGPNRLWLADLTEHATAEGTLYACAIKDVWSNRIVGCSIDGRMTSQLVVRALESAVARRGGDVAGCRLHSDRGAQFRARTVQRSLFRHRIRGSMGQVGTSADNAAMESYFSLLQNNVLNRHQWGSRQQLRTAIVSWIERTYHRRRRQARLGRLTPVEFETIMTPAAGLAA